MTYREETIGDCRLINADCRELLPTLGNVDAVASRPPMRSQTCLSRVPRNPNS
jgi:hypothetical protein